MSDKALQILISDDSILARKQLKDVIIKQLPDVQFVEAANGQEAIDKFKETKPDMVFLDIVMPIKDGIEATKGIMEIDNKADIIIVSSVGTKMQLKSAIEAGARDFIQKPMNPSQVISVLESHLGGK
ncbi:MAG: response regulator [Lachnospiraceae bacterium]|nr:response regulator [Lachnospiraceae bacterium]